MYMNRRLRNQKKIDSVNSIRHIRYGLICEYLAVSRHLENNALGITFRKNILRLDQKNTGISVLVLYKQISYEQQKMEITVFDNIFSFTEYDAKGKTVSTTLKMSRDIKNFYLFDIGDNNTLGIKVRSASGSKVNSYDIDISPVFVRSDMSYEEFHGGFDEDEDNSVVNFGRRTKFNAVSLRRNLLGGPETKPVIFAVSPEHFSEVSSLSQTKSVKRDPNMYVAEYNYPPDPEIIASKNMQYILTEIEADGNISRHKMSTDIFQLETFPAKTTVTAYIAKGNKLKIDVLNLGQKPKHFLIRPKMRNGETYPTSDSIVEPNTVKTLTSLTADPDSDYVIVQKSIDMADRGSFTFSACDTPPPSKSYDRPRLDSNDNRPLAPPKSTYDFYTELSKLRITKEMIITNLYKKGQISTEESEILRNI